MKSTHTWPRAMHWLSAAALLATAGAAHATLVDLGDGTVKDTNTNLIWLQDWGMSGDGDRDTQKAWAEGLDYAGSSDWILPSFEQYRTLFSAYGGFGVRSSFTDNTGEHWTSSPGPLGTSYGRTVEGRDGSGAQQFLTARLPAAAVRLDTGTANVPEPQTLALALLALGATALARRRPR